MINLESARVVGSVFVGFGLLMLMVTGLMVWFAGMLSPISFVIGVWMVSVGTYQFATNTSSSTPPEQIPRRWIAGLAAVTILSIAGAILLIVFAHF